MTMRPLKALIPLDEAMSIALREVHPIRRTEVLPITDAHRRVASKNIKAPADVPTFDRAAMDGYAVRAQDTYGATKFHPKVLRCVETLYAETLPKRALRKGQCAEVATGSMVPKGADAVVMVEATEKERDDISIHSPVHPQENISRRGEDLRRGQTVISAGELLTPAKLGAIAAIGQAEVEVYERPKVSIMTTGNEIQDLGKPLRAGQVYNINSYTLAAAVREHGGMPTIQPIVPDDLPALRAAFRRAAKYDFILFSGGSSVGERDMMLDAVAEQGELLFHGIAVKPGKPTVFGLYEGKPLLGMPGYPTSCLSNAYFMLGPLLRKMAHLPPDPERVIEAPLAKRVISAIGRLEFLTVRLQNGEAHPAYKESGAITSMAHADGYIEIPANVDLLDRGERVRVVLF